jgi:hypothetical protein
MLLWRPFVQNKGGLVVNAHQKFVGAEQMKAFEELNYQIP